MKNSDGLRGLKWPLLPSPMPLQYFNLASATSSFGVAAKSTLFGPMSSGCGVSSIGPGPFFGIMTFCASQDDLFLSIGMSGNLFRFRQQQRPLGLQAMQLWLCFSLFLLSCYCNENKYFDSIVCTLSWSKQYLANIVLLRDPTHPSQKVLACLRN